MSSDIYRSFIRRFTVVTRQDHKLYSASDREG